jgi:hypothetical protein
MQMPKQNKRANAEKPVSLKPLNLKQALSSLSRVKPPPQKREEGNDAEDKSKNPKAKHRAVRRTDS